MRSLEPHGEATHTMPLKRPPGGPAVDVTSLRGFAGEAPVTMEQRQVIPIGPFLNF